MEKAYVIRPVVVEDLPLLGQWRGRPHVRRWWGDPPLEPEHEKLSDPRIAMWIGEWRGRPFAFIQDYDVHGWQDHHFGHLPEPSRGMDLYIGELDLIGFGHGVALIRQHVDQLFREGVLAIGIDPHPDSAAARRAYERAGFRVASGPIETRWNRALLMERRSVRDT
jgi:aminoglycoside 6'-N-acetyltransferase